MADITPDALRAAAGVLGIGDLASINEIRSRYHDLVKEWHPDISQNKTADLHNTMVRINDAYQTLITYCMEYRISFRPEDLRQIRGASPMDMWMEQYGDDPIWGPYRHAPKDKD